MRRESILSMLGYDPTLLDGLSAAHRSRLRGLAIGWLLVCLALGLATAYAGWLVSPVIWMPICGGVGMTLLTINLLRVIIAGGGVEQQDDLRRVEEACRRYRPGMTLALVMGVLAAIFAQPAQLPLWSDIEVEVEAHRQALISQHEAAAATLGVDTGHHRTRLEKASFPIQRLKIIWRRPAQALRWTAVFVLLVLLPALWSRYVVIDSVRAYELVRSQRKHAHAKHLIDQRRAVVHQLLSRWPTYEGGAS